MTSQPSVREPASGIDPKLHSIAYLRVSTKDQATKGGEPEGLSIPAQRTAIEAKAASGYETAIRIHFSDMGESARTADRPGLQQLLSYLQTNKVDYVFVHKIDRLARNRFDDIEITMAIQKAGARLVSVTENIDETPSGMLMHGIMSSIAEFYSRNLANEVVKGLEQKARSGGTPGLAPLGYLNVRTMTPGRGEVRSVEIDPERAPFVKLAFDLYVSGDYTVERLAGVLAEQGLTSRPTTKRTASALSITQLSMLLRNPYYTGVVSYKGQQYQGRHEPLVTATIFEKAQEVLQIRSRQGSRDRVHLHYLKGQLFCDRCAEAGRTSRLVYTEARSHSGELYGYYLCRGRQEKLCDLPYLPIAVVERAILDHYAHLWLPDDYLDTMKAQLEACLSEEQGTTRQLHLNLSKKLAELDTQEERLLDLAVAGTLPQAKIQQRLAKVEADRRDATASLTETSKQLAIGVAVLASGLDLLRDTQALYEGAPDAARRSFNHAFFTRFYLNERGQVTRSELTGLFADLHKRSAVGAKAESNGGKATKKSPWHLCQGLLRFCSTPTRPGGLRLE